MKAMKRDGKYYLSIGYTILETDDGRNFKISDWDGFHVVGNTKDCEKIYLEKRDIREDLHELTIHNRLQKSIACEIARNAHDGQKDKAGEDYFEAHVRPVAESVFKRTNSCTAAAVGYLHDVLEDTEMTEAQLRSMFDSDIVDAVVALTRKKDEPYMEYIRRLKQNRYAVEVKLCDLANNMDLDRLPEVTEKDRKRNEKYMRAYVELMK